MCNWKVDREETLTCHSGALRLIDIDRSMQGQIRPRDLK